MQNTELGEIPSDWISTRFDDVLTGFASGMTPYRGKPEYYKGEIPWITSGELDYSQINDTFEKITEDAVRKTNLKKLPKGTFLIAITGLEAEGTRGSCGITGVEATTNQSCMALFPKPGKITTPYLFHFYVRYGNELAFRYCQGTKQQSYTGRIAKILPINLPPTVAEQTAIATALSDADALIESLEKLIAKKRLIKQGAMQELLRPKKGWVKKSLYHLVDCLDNLRIPLNESERSKMSGDFPYCGANGILDYIDRYCVDDNIILIAEDGGYFDEYSTRPIAYRMSGKCWVNNHAHILKSKAGVDQNFIFYSLVHKNILNYLASGTRAKLNKSEMFKIEISIPTEETEQSKIADTIDQMSLEIQKLEIKCNKIEMIKQGMMQNLLTGKIRLV